MLSRSALCNCFKLSLVIWIIYWTWIFYYSFKTGTPATKLISKSFFIDEAQCVLSYVDPYSTESMKFWDPSSKDCWSRNCTEFTSPVKLEGNKIVIDNNTEEQSCPLPRSYQIINPYGSISPKGYSFDVETSSDFNLVKCDKKEYIVVAPVRREDIVKNRKSLIKYTNKYPPINILGIGFDSMSHANFERNLPKSLGFLKKNFNKTGTLFELNGYNIVGDGTTANLGGILVGKGEKDLPESRNRIKGSKHIDTWPWIWSEATSKGYITAYLEDEPSLGAFTLRLKGWKNQPTDHFMFAFWKAVTKKNMKSYCHSGMWDWERHLQYSCDMFTTYHDVPKFVFGFSKISHTECLSTLSRFDTKIEGWLEKIYNLPGFENTFFFLFGDHGPRYGKMRATLQGKLEERLPGMYIKVPDWFANDYPQILTNLKDNQNRLVTPYDMYATLQHVINFPDPPKLSPYRHSLFLPISNTRTCMESKIDNHWCLCRKRRRVDNIDEIVLEGAGLLINVLNSRLEEHGENRCVPVHLSQVINAETIVYSKQMLSFVSSLDTDGRKPKYGIIANITEVEYQIQFELTPGGGILEGDFTVNNGTITTGTYFSRLNEYGELKCEPKPLIREFCVCREN